MCIYEFAEAIYTKHSRLKPGADSAKLEWIYKQKRTEWHHIMDPDVCFYTPSTAASIIAIVHID